MNGSVIVGILFKYAPLRSVCFLVDFFHFPLPPSLPLPFFLLSPALPSLFLWSLYSPFSILIFSLAHGIQRQRGLFIYLFILRATVRAGIYSVHPGTGARDRMAQSQPRQGMMGKWDMLKWATFRKCYESLCR